MPGEADIKQVPIGPPQAKRKKRYSARVRKTASVYLQQHGLTTEELNELQQDAVFRFAKQKRNAKVLLVFTVMTVALYATVSVWGYGISMKLLADLAPTSVRIIQDDGTEKYVELIPEDREMLSMYGRICAMYVSGLVVLVYTGASFIGSFIGSFFATRRTKKMLDAFLPAIATQHKSHIPQPQLE